MRKRPRQKPLKRWLVVMMEEHQAAEAEKAHKHSYKFGGYVKADVIYSDFDGGSYQGAGRDFYIPATVQVGDGGESYLDFHAKESRINFKSTHLLDNGAKLERLSRWTFCCPATAMSEFPIRTTPACVMHS